MKDNVVYESPDSGTTLYARIANTDKRVKIDKYRIMTSDEIKQEIADGELWAKIRFAAKENPALHDLLERAKVLYYLSDDNGT